MSIEDKRKQLITWIKNAYSMEKTQIKMLDVFIKDFDDDTTIKNKLKTHRSETEKQCKQLEACLNKFDESPSKIKAATGSMMGLMQGMSTSISGDEKVKDMLMIYAGENFEYAAYMSIKEAADELDEKDIKKMADRIAKEERRTASWAEKQIPLLTKRRLAMAAG